MSDIEEVPAEYFAKLKKSDAMGDLKAKTLRDAEAHCAASHQTFEVVGTSESKPPYILANYPRVELTFRCVAQ